jgi:hexosaminidase
MPYAIPNRGIHLDLKGAPLPIDALIVEIERMATWGINLLLIEYEDTFPYAFDPAIRAATAYTPADIVRIVKMCKSLNVQIVPLVQTFGHLEFVLKHPRYRHLAQTAGSFSSVDPTLPESRQLVLHMVDELLAAHPDSRWFHLGGDEVWDLGEGERSCKRAAEIGKDGLYLEHMTPIIDHVITRGVRPILWDDMMRKWSLQSLLQLAPKVDLMAWSYAAAPFAWITQEVLDKFEDAGLHLWAGAAFKGADGITADLPNDRVRMSNLEAWAGYAARNNWEGMVATGWSRYSGTTTCCELWQAAPMSLYLAAEVMRKGHFDFGDWDKACRETIGTDSLPVDWTTQRFPLKALDAGGGASANGCLTQLKAIAAVNQWRRDAHGVLADRWQALGYHEDVGLHNDWDLDRIRKMAGDVEAAWPAIAAQFEQVMKDSLHPRDIHDYLASRRRIGLDFLRPILETK